MFHLEAVEDRSECHLRIDTSDDHLLLVFEFATVDADHKIGRASCRERVLNLV